MSELVGILLAAGKGERFGGNKGLAILPDGVPMAMRSALNLRYMTPRTICVTRPGDSVLQSLFSEQGFEVVVVEHAQQGMSASLQAGINAAPQAAGWVVALADMPLIRAETYQKLSAAFAAQPQITVPCFQAEVRAQGLIPASQIQPASTQQGHPVIFPACYKNELMALNGDKGAKAIMRRHAGDIQRVWVDDPGIQQDFDTPAAFKRLFI